MDLFSYAEKEEQAERIVSVGQLTQSIRAMLEGGFSSVAVRGEISNWRPAGSGHIYFSLKDADAVVSVALFRGTAQRLRQLASLRDGVEVVLKGKISVFPPRGAYQIIASSLEPVGAGGLQAKFEALKRKLQAEGLFDPARKRKIPAFPSRIVVITSPTGAAIRDVLSVLRRRFAGVQVLVIPALVQGAEAGKDLLRALRTANEHSLGDVILLTRGGGSLEDLFCFNDEALAREIFSSRIPVVSAVGHEIDFTIADFVADLRAPTPSAAAELLVREQEALLETLRELSARLARAARSELQQARLQLRGLLSALKNPRDRINELRLRFDDWTERLEAAVAQALKARRQRLQRLEESLNALSPLRVLERGYAIAFDAGGHAIRRVEELPAGASFVLRLQDGSVAASSTGRK